MKIDPATGLILFLACLVGRAQAGSDEILLKLNEPPSQLAVSADGKVLAAKKSGGNIVLWSIPEKKLLHEVVDSREYFNCLALSPNHEFLASASLKSIRLWDVSTGEEKGVLNGHKSVILSIDFSPEGKSLASVSQGGTLIVWDVDARTEKSRAKVFPCEHATVAFRTDGSILIAMTKDNWIQVREVRNETSKVVARAPHNNWKIHRLSFSPDRKKLAVAVERDSFDPDREDNDQVHLWDLDSAEIAQRERRYGLFSVFPADICPKWGRPLLGHKGPIWDIVFTHDGTRLLTSSGGRDWLHIDFDETGETKRKSLQIREHAIKAWDLAAMQEIATFQGHKDSVRALAISADSNTVYSAGRDSTIRAWRIAPSLAEAAAPAAQTP
jgi:WD40 repeat protein